VHSEGRCGALQARIMGKGVVHLPNSTLASSDIEYQFPIRNMNRLPENYPCSWLMLLHLKLIHTRCKGWTSGSSRRMLTCSSSSIKLRTAKLSTKYINRHIIRIASRLPASRGRCLAWQDASLGRWRSLVRIRPAPSVFLDMGKKEKMVMISTSRLDLLLW
jgi:hypothetical protein